MIAAILLSLLTQVGTCKAGAACQANSFKATQKPLGACAPLVVPCFLSDGGTDGGSCNDGGYNPNVRGLLEYDYNGQFTDAGTYVVCNGRTWVGLAAGSGSDTCTGTGPCAIGQGGYTTDAGTNVLVARVAGLPNEVFKITDASGHVGIGLTWENGVSDWYLQKLGGGTNQDMVLQLGNTPLFTFSLTGDLTLSALGTGVLTSTTWINSTNSCGWQGLGSQLFANCILRTNSGLALDGTGNLWTMDNAGGSNFNGATGVSTSKFTATAASAATAFAASTGARWQWGGTSGNWAAEVAGGLNFNAAITVSSTLTVGQITLSSGSGTATVSSNARCVCQDTNASPLAVQCSVSSTTLTAVETTGSHVITYICL